MEPRVHVEVQVDFATEHNFYTGLTQDLSGGGLFVATHQIRRLGELVSVRLHLPGSGRAFEILTEVRWVRERDLSPGMGMGMGLRFLQMSPEAKAAIRAFLGKRESLFFEE